MAGLVCHSPLSQHENVIYMATETAVPGSVVSIGSLYSPGGAQGIPGATGPTGATGTAGTTGPAGTAATIAAGTTSTLAPGSNATVSNSGSSSAAVFNFGIPAGQTGAQGPQGNPGVNTLATTSANGLLKQISGNTTDFVDGTNSCQNLVAALAGLLVPTGSVLDFAGGVAPTGFLLCNGAAVSRTTYSVLFGAISITYGAGDGSTTFNLPDLRSVVTVGAGQGTGLTNRVLAARGGEENHQLTIAELASHTHIQNPHTHQILSYAGSPAGGTFHVLEAGALTNGLAGNTTATNQNTGSDTAHNNMPPFVVLNKIIKT
jgi:microcystin-dependent protein